MDINTKPNGITIPVGYNQDGTRFDIQSIHEISDYGIAVSWWPRTAFLVEWEWNGKHRSREVIMLPRENTQHWLDDLVRARAKNNVVLVGIMPLADIELPEYEIPTAYRAEMERLETSLAGGDA